MKVTTINFEASNNLEVNYTKILGYICNHAGDSDMIVFPEASLQGYTPLLDEKSLEDISSSAIVAQGENKYIKGIRELSMEYQTHLCLGFIERDPNESEVLFNSLLFIYPTGDFHVYRKSHLSTNEHYIFHPGNTLQVIPTKFGKIGFLICYDVCFPEAARKLRLDGANIIVLISAWGYDRSQNNSRAKSLDILHSYCKVRAVENQILFIMANQAGGNSISFLGESAIFLPSGVMVANNHECDGVAKVEVCIERVILEERLLNLNALNLMKNRRPELYF